MKIAVAGYGTEGKTSAKYWSDLGHEVVVLDENPATESEFTVESGPNVFDDLSGYDLVVRTPGIRPDRLKNARKIWSATNEFFDKCPAPIIGVTGTKGKGTTASLIASVLSQASKTVHLVGNIGTPALEVLKNVDPEDTVIYELSSFQLWDLEKSPHLAVVLMIEPDHLDVHSDMEEYVEAKSHITGFQTEEDTAIYHPTNRFSRQIAMHGSGKKVRYDTPEDEGVYIKENTFFVQNDPICSVDTLQVVGRHNVENACAAITAVLALDPDTEKNAIEKGLAAFSGLPHRLKLAGEANGVRYYDDSIATTPGSAEAAIKSFAEPKVLILGGSDKGADYHSVVELCRETSTRVITLGETGSRIAELCKEAGVEVKDTGKSGMETVVETARAWAKPGDIVILSPAAASFDMFKNYQDRGEQFIAAVKNLSVN